MTEKLRGLWGFEGSEERWSKETVVLKEPTSRTQLTDE
jgi:hypothetical protein